MKVNLIPKRLSRSQRYNLKMRKLENKAIRLKEGTAKTAVREAASTLKSITGTIAGQKTIENTQAARLRASGLNLYNNIISGNPSNGEEGKTQSGSTTQLPKDEDDRGSAGGG